MDENALNAINSAATELKKDSATSLKTLATTISNQTGTKAIYGASGWVAKLNQDGGLSVAAAKLEKQQVSSIIKSTSGDGYCLVRLLDINDTQVSYEYIQVPLTAFTEALEKVQNSDKVTEFISIPKS